MLHPIDADTGLQVRPTASRFPVGPCTIDELFSAAVPTQVALVDGDRRWTYLELEHETAAIAAGLIANGVTPSARVAWSRVNDAELVLGFIATLRARAIWVGLNPRLTAAEADTILNDCEPAMVIKPRSELPRATFTVMPACTGSAAAAIGYTSGTTGQPKGAVHTHQQLLYPAAASIATEPIGPNEVVGTPLPLTTLNLMLLGPLTAFARGTTATIMQATDAHGFAAEVSRHQVTRTLLVPTLLHDLIEAESPTRDLTSTLQTVLVGGAAADPGLRERAALVLGVEPTGSYGLSEAPTGVARTSKSGRGAQPLPGIDIAIADDGEVVLNPTATDEWANSWSPTLGYWRQPEATSNLYRSGALHTGDIGSIDAQGLLVVDGRAGDMINRGGANVAPLEVERALFRHPLVADAVVVGIADERLGQRVAAAIVLRDTENKGDIDLDEIAASTRDVLAGYKVPATINVLKRLPRTTAGKIDRQAAAASFDN